jgi:hypothetical protein
MIITFCLNFKTIRLIFHEYWAQCGSKHERVYNIIITITITTTTTTTTTITTTFVITLPAQPVIQQQQQQGQ